MFKTDKNKNGLLLSRYLNQPRYTETERVFFMLYYYIFCEVSLLLCRSGVMNCDVCFYTPLFSLSICSVISNNTTENCNSLSMQMSLKIYPRALLQLKILTRAFSES